MPPERNLAALGERVRNVLLDLRDGLGVDQWPLLGDAQQAVADAQLAHGIDEFRDEPVIDAFLHQQAICADAGLAGVAVLAGDGALHCEVEVRIVEHDERRIAAEFERHFLHACPRTAP